MRSRRRAVRIAVVAVVTVVTVAACAGDDAAEQAQASDRAASGSAASTESNPDDSDNDITTTPPSTAPETTAATTPTTSGTGHAHDMDAAGQVDADVLRAAHLGAAAFQDLAVAEASGWVSTAETLGCFENPGQGGMGVHWLNESLLDAELDPARPEALVYELGADGEVVGLVGHEYLVPFDAWTSEEPPELFGVELMQHDVLPFWILHLYIWKDNPDGLFANWNPAVRMCPEGVAVFGEDLP